ncbi:uncharacterized protein VTP21DRAFT_11106 [Calcarisporiella thermophila]|uniref:uncharacterized protein n=1 Tax=Calcarisporiella thermophila TaxID=911321 RepID=UPI0037429921
MTERSEINHPVSTPQPPSPHSRNVYTPSFQYTRPTNAPLMDRKDLLPSVSSLSPSIPAMYQHQQTIAQHFGLPPIKTKMEESGVYDGYGASLPGGQRVGVSSPVSNPEQENSVPFTHSFTPRSNVQYHAHPTQHPAPYPPQPLQFRRNQRAVEQHQSPTPEMAPFFYPTKQFCTLYSMDRTNELRVTVHAKTDKGFFIAENDWTCYRRNYFHVSCAFNVQGVQREVLEDAVVPCMVEASPGQLRVVSCFLLGINARVSNSERRVELVQHTPKRDKGPQTTPVPKPVLAGGDPNSNSLVSGPRANVACFERLQFKTATANNGKRRAAQQYYVLLVELWGVCSESGEQIKVAAAQSAPIVVRGRSPGHYADSNANAGGKDGELKQQLDQKGTVYAIPGHMVTGGDYYVQGPGGDGKAAPATARIGNVATMTSAEYPSHAGGGVYVGYLPPPPPPFHSPSNYVYQGGAPPNFAPSGADPLPPSQQPPPPQPHRNAPPSYPSQRQPQPQSNSDGSSTPSSPSSPEQRHPYLNGQRNEAKQENGAYPLPPFSASQYTEGRMISGPGETEYQENHGSLADRIAAQKSAS